MWSNAVIIKNKVGDSKYVVELYEFHQPKRSIVPIVQRFDTQPHGTLCNSVLFDWMIMDMDPGYMCRFVLLYNTNLN